MSIWVITEWDGGRLREISLGLLAEGRRVAHAAEFVSAVVMEERPEDEIRRVFQHGADEIIHVDLPSVWAYHIHLTAEVLARLMEERQPRLVLLAASPAGNEIAGRISARCEAGLVTNANRLELENDRMIVVKGAFRDGIENRFTMTTQLQLVTFKGKELQPSKPVPARTGRVVRPEIAWNSDGQVFEIVSHLAAGPSHQDLQDAEMVVAGGRGVGGKKGFERIHRLAELLGASVGGSREAVDRGWLPYTHQIGQTGRTIAPRCLIALGISGATQFLRGVQDAELVIAVNNDPGAPIFDYADLKIHGDLHEVVEALMGCVEQLRSPAQEEGRG